MLPSVVEMTRELVAIPSVSSIDPRLDRPNRPVVERVAALAAEVGFRTEIVPVPDKEGKANLIATLGEGPGGLVLSGHTDTVPWDEGAWRTDPFTATEQDGRLYGLGATDMKGFFGIALHAAARFAGRSLKE